MTLDRKAFLLETDLQRRFLSDGEVYCKLMLPTAGRSFVAYNMPDNAYMTGIYMGMLAMQYAVTKDPGVMEQARETLKALNRLATISGKPGILARATVRADMPFADDGVWLPSADGRWRWRTHTDNDQLDGVLYGYWLAYGLVAGENEKRDIAKNVSDLVSNILDNGLRIHGIDGHPVEYGNYTREYVTKTESMNALLLLQHLKIAHHITREERFAKEYERLAWKEGYAQLAVTARLMDTTDINYSDDVLNWLAFYPLLKMETDAGLVELYKAGLRRAWEGVRGAPGIKGEQNSLYAFMVDTFLGDRSGVAEGVQSLRLFPLDMKWNQATLDKYEAEFGFSYDRTPSSPKPPPGAAVPLDRRPKQWSVWVHAPYTEASRLEESSMEYNGLDYLMAYWLGRYHGYIAAQM